MEKENKQSNNIEEIYDIRIIIRPRENITQICGTGDSWLDLALLMEAVCCCMAENKNNGIPQEKLEKRIRDYLDEIRDYFDKMKEDYKK